MYVEKEVARRRILGLDVPEDDTQQQQQQADASADAAAAGRKRRRGAPAAAGDHAADGSDAAVAEDGEGPESQAEAAAAAGGPSLDQVVSDQQQQQQQNEREQGLQEAQAAVKAVLTGAIARLVYQNALKTSAAAATKGASSSNYLRPNVGSSGSSGGGYGSSGSSLEFRAGFLQVLGRYTSPGVVRLKQEIVDSIRQDFPLVRPRAF